MIKKTINISIGVNCYPRIFIKNIGFSKNNGYKSCPFDLCITPFNSLKKCLEDDFFHFYDGLNLIPGINGKGDRTLSGKGFENITNYYGMVFNHESPTHSHLFKDGQNDDNFYIRNDFLEFKKRYNTRINNFRNYLDEYDNICFVYTRYPGIESDGNLDDICNIFRNKYPFKTITYKII